jgi:DNA polymerase-4
VAEDLRRKGYVGRTIGIKLRYEDFRTATRDLTLDHFTSDAGTIRRAAGQCLKRVDLSSRLRLLGVRVGKLARADESSARSAGIPASPPAAAEQTADLFQEAQTARDSG